MIRRVLMTADTIGGVWNYSLDLARELGKHDVAVALATMGRPMSADQLDEAHRIPNLEVYESDYKLEWMPEPWRDIQRAGRWLLALEDAFRPDIVHLNGYCHGAIPWGSPTVMVCHSCVLSWWEAVKGGSAPAEWERYHCEVLRGLQAARTVVAPTQAMLGAAERFYGPFKRSCVIPNARDPLAFYPGKKESMVFAAGRLWDEAKNVRALDESAADIDWPVYLAGDNGDAKTRSCARRLGRLTSGEIAQWLGRASIYALPARYEPFGLSILEAALSGCALVLGDIATLRENWEGCALFVNPDDRNSLREAIQSLIEDPSLRARLAKAARNRALEFTPERFADGYLDLYRSLHERSRVKGKALVL